VNEQEIRSALGALEVYKAQLEGVAEQQQILQVSLEEYSRAKDTLTEFAKAEEGDEVMVPIGGASFIYAKVSNPKRVLVGVGTGVTVEKDTTEALELMTTRTQEMLDALKKLSESRAAIEMKSEQLSQLLQAEYQRLGEQQQQPLM
jgi:prefoldin alpha subunit